MKANDHPCTEEWCEATVLQQEHTCRGSVIWPGEKRPRSLCIQGQCEKCRPSNRQQGPGIFFGSCVVWEGGQKRNDEVQVKEATSEKTSWATMFDSVENVFKKRCLKKTF